ncbi:MAG: hypothetical protein ABI686_07925 [Acidobacteriota bacterium]
MKIFFLVFFIAFSFFQNQCDKSKTSNSNKPLNTMMTNQTETKFDRLPDGVKLSDEVRKDVLNDKGEVVSYRTVTVEEELKKLGAKYVSEKLVDRDGKEIKFYTPAVRGASQGFEEDAKQRDRDKKELDELQSKYTVIILYVDPRKVS